MISEGNFVKNIDTSFYSNSEESLFDTLFRDYERVVFKSIITAFALDPFIKDQHGGDVDTIHNVRRMSEDPKMKYKSAANEKAYENRGAYSHKDVEGPGTNFQRMKHEKRNDYREDPRKNTVKDAYENKELGFLGKSKGHPTDKSAELDHVISAKKIHDDRGRVLAGKSTKDLADDPDNLKWTNEHLNKSLNDDEIPDYIAKHPELDDKTKKRMMDAYKQSKNKYERTLAKSYYFDFSNPNCRQFYKETALNAGKRGLQMGLRQALGFLATELWFAIKEEWTKCERTLTGAFQAIGNGIKKWSESVKKNYKFLIKQLGEGLISGIISSLTTTLANTFITTTANVTRIIRQSWASVVEAASIIFFNTKDEYLCNRMTSAAKVLAAGASIIIGATVQETVHIELSQIAGLPNLIKDIVSTFAGSLCTGCLTISLLFYIDNDPFSRKLDELFGVTYENLKKQGKLFKKYCAELEKIDMQEFIHKTNLAYDLTLALDHANNDMEVNKLLRKAANDLGLSLPWGNGTLADKLSDPAWELHF
ncbi:MAG: hypothetical protein K6G50_00580 [bacterium]|nr:hypothetical protein [bacterium]